MPDQLSKSQIDKLGERLRDAAQVSEDALAMLQQVRAEYDDAMSTVANRLAEELGLEPGTRLKTVGTIVDKLRREHIRLSQMQDIAGVRVVRAMGLDEQDDLVGAIAALFNGARVVDRRESPSYGYRAVHVIVAVDGRGVEIQVRTELQHLWAQVFERMADLLGRGIRYGLPPRSVPGVRADEIFVLITDWAERSEFVAEIEQLDCELATTPDSAAHERLARIKESTLRVMQEMLSTFSMGESSS